MVVYWTYNGKYNDKRRKLLSSTFINISVKSFSSDVKNQVVYDLVLEYFQKSYPRDSRIYLDADLDDLEIAKLMAYLHENDYRLSDTVVTISLISSKKKRIVLYHNYDDAT